MVDPTIQSLSQLQEYLRLHYSTISPIAKRRDMKNTSKNKTWPRIGPESHVARGLWGKNLG